MAQFVCILYAEVTNMANEEKKDFNAMLHDSKDMPKFQTITDRASIENKLLAEYAPCRIID